VVSKNTIKRITSLGQKKYRQRERVFVAEGIKVVHELLHSDLELVELYAEDVSAFAKALQNKNQAIIEEVSAADLKKITFLKTAQKAVATFRMPEAAQLDRSGLTLLLDDVRDPGNLGTIIRLCDWFGIKQLVCSIGTVDCFNPKVVQATMGSLTRVDIVYTNLEEYLENDSRKVFGTFMDGTNIYAASLPAEGIIIMGNEANGISQEIESLVSDRIAIPRFGEVQATESLNVATATAICLSEFKRG
jgi:TrmH family RNA methyltransferase